MRCTGLPGSVTIVVFGSSRALNRIQTCLHTVCWSVSPPPLTALFRSPSEFLCRLMSSAVRYSRHEEVVLDRDILRCCSVRRVAVHREGSTADRWPFLLPRLVQRIDSRSNVKHLLRIATQLTYVPVYSRYSIRAFALLFCVVVCQIRLPHYRQSQYRQHALLLITG